MQSHSKCASEHELTVAYMGSPPGAQTKNDEYPLSLNHIADGQLANEVRRMSEEIELLRQETGTSVVAQAAAGSVMCIRRSSSP